MTVAVAVRTNTSVVFAADSKVTTSGLAAIDENGQQVFVTQTYDGATKIVADKSERLLAMVAGNAAVGEEPITDFVGRWQSPPVKP